MSILDTVLAVAIFLGLFASVEYVTYGVMESKHEKRNIYELLFMLAWTTLAFVHMWVVAPLLNLPPTAVVALGLGILMIYVAGGLGIPVFKSIGVIGLYPFALVYELFVVLLLFAEAVAVGTSFVTITQFNFISTIVPGDSRVQAIIGLGAAASLVAVMYYNPDGENGYHYAAGRHVTPSVDYEKFRRIRREDRERNEPDGPLHQGDSSRTSDSGGKSRHSYSTKTPVKSSSMGELEYNWIRSDIGFDDVAGYYEVKERLAEEVLQPVQAAARGDDRYDRFGIEPSRGILFYGPPGTGKTLFARALAGELDIPFVELGPADVTSKWINEGPQRIRQLFEEAEAVGPCVIFLDEAEHLFGGRDVGTGGAHAEDRKITSELLVHLTADDRTGIVVGATNRPEDIDPAILRPGRLATHVEIGLPREESRHAIFQSKLRGVPHDLTGDQLAQLASHTAGLSGADIEELVTDAKRRAARRDAQNVSIEDFPSAEGVATERNDTEAEPMTDRDLNDSNELDTFPEDPFDDDPTAGFR
ncbi:ATP-binding protein [Haloplanus salinus]|uniref:ATP-binding protein n=1 Tax=Haloplanus salinus TaxID=1126245 RepID=A0A368N1F8_9EURY|nr:ATP-binding protein [Haloplanus salinus]RCU44318.1 ATP-binding protein [Haloplanus salinus]